MALLLGGSAREASGVSWRFRGSKNTPFKPVNLPLPVSCGEVRALLKEEIGLLHTPQLDALLFFAEDEEISHNSVTAPTPLSDFLTLSRPCRVVLQRTSAATAKEALARADAALLQGPTAAQHQTEQQQQHYDEKSSQQTHAQQRQSEGHQARRLGVATTSRSDSQTLTAKGESSSSSSITVTACGRGTTGAADASQQQQLRPENISAAAAATGNISTVVPVSGNVTREIVTPSPSLQQQRVQQVNVQEGACLNIEEEAQDLEDRAADEEAEAALLHAVIEQHAEHRGPQHQYQNDLRGTTAASGLRSSGAGWGGDDVRGAGGGYWGGGIGKGGGGGIGGAYQQLHMGRRNLVWSRDGVGNSSAASIAAATTGGHSAAAFSFNRGILRGGNAVGAGGHLGNSKSYYCGYNYNQYPVDPDYICHFCGERGAHHIRNCTKAQDPRQQKKVKPATGIPSSFLQDIDVDDIPAYQEVYIRRDGSFAVMKNTKKLSSHSFFSLDLETKVERHTGSSSSTSQLRCGLCNTLFKNPVTTPCCGETFCYSCLLKALQQQVMLHRVEEQKQLYGALPNFGERGGIEGEISLVKEEMMSKTSESRRWRSRAGVAYDAVEREKKSRNFFLPHSNTHTGTVGPAFPAENRRVGGSFAVSEATRKSMKGKGGLCPACGSALDLKDVVENVALRKCVDAIVMQSSPQEDTKVPSVPHQQKTLSQQSKHQQEQQPWQQQQQAQQQENRRLVKEQKGGADDSPPRRSQGQVKKEKEGQSSMVAIKQEDDQQKVKQEQHWQVQVHCKTETKEVFGSAAAARSDAANVPGNAADSGDSREEISRAAGDSSVVSAARVSVVKTEAGATTSSSSATASVHLPPVSLSSSSGVAPFTDSNKHATDSVLSLSSLVSDGEKIQRHEDAWACLSGAEAADAHKTSAAATMVVDAAAAAPSRITDVTGLSAGLQSTVAQQQPDTTGVVATAAPTVTVSASTHPDVKSQEQGTGPPVITSSCGSTSSDGRGHSGGGSARSISSSTISGAHRANAAANGTSALPYSAGTAAATHVSGGAPPILPTASAPHHASGTSRVSVVNNNPSSCRSGSSEAVHDVVQGEYTDRSVVTNAGTTDAGASGAQEQGDHASASKSGVLNDLDISQLQDPGSFALSSPEETNPQIVHPENISAQGFRGPTQPTFQPEHSVYATQCSQQDFAAAYIQQYMERKKDKMKKRKKRRRRHADSSSSDTDDSSSSDDDRSHGRKRKKKKKRTYGHHGKKR